MTQDRCTIKTIKGKRHWATRAIAIYEVTASCGETYLDPFGDKRQVGDEAKCSHNKDGKAT